MSRIWNFGLAAVVATAHDVLMTIAFVAVMKLEVSLVVVAAFPAATWARRAAPLACKSPSRRPLRPLSCNAPTPAGERLFHPRGPRLALWARRDQRNAGERSPYLQVRFRRGGELLQPSREGRSAQRGWNFERGDLVPRGLRQTSGHDQVCGYDASSCQDGDPRRRPP